MVWDDEGQVSGDSEVEVSVEEGLPEVDRP